MITTLSLPPKDKSLLTPPDEIINRLKVLLGSRFQLTRKTRTDGSNLRKLVMQTLVKYSLPTVCNENEFSVISPKRK